MKKIIRLTESDLTILVKRVIKENIENNSLHSDIMGLIRNSNSSHEETIDVLNSIVDEMSSSRRLRRDVEKRFRDDMNENEDEEMESSDLQSQFESMIDEIGEQVIEDSFYGELTDDDMESFASIVSDSVNDKIKEMNPNMKVDYTIYYGGDLEFYIFDNDEEEIVATYRPSL